MNMTVTISLDRCPSQKETFVNPDTKTYDILRLAYLDAESDRIVVPNGHLSDFFRYCGFFGEKYHRLCKFESRYVSRVAFERRLLGPEPTITIETSDGPVSFLAE